jgi:hypothetical protein
MNYAERAALYNAAFPDYPPLTAHGEWVTGSWDIGNNYKGSGYYGAYPGNYLKRLMSMFPDARDIAHLFAGSLPPGPYLRIDVKPPTEPGNYLQADAERLSEFVPETMTFDLMPADPPYSAVHSTHYGCKMPNRLIVTREAAKVVRPGGTLAWLDTKKPMYRKSEWKLWGEIGIFGSTNHDIRGLCLFERVGEAH